MKVKIGNKIYDAEDEPIMIILNEGDKKNIGNMDEDKFKYVIFPKGYDNESIRGFIDEYKATEVDESPDEAD